MNTGEEVKKLRDTRNREVFELITKATQKCKFSFIWAAIPGLIWNDNYSGEPIYTDGLEIQFLFRLPEPFKLNKRSFIIKSFESEAIEAQLQKEIAAWNTQVIDYLQSLNHEN